MIVKEEKWAPCGRCRKEIRRDEMHAMNVKFFDEDDEEEKVQVRLCEDCRSVLEATVVDMRWNNAEMFVKTGE